MTTSNSFNKSTDLKHALFDNLLRRIPPEIASPHLEDLVNALTDALLQGEVSLDLTICPPLETLKAQDWPNGHIKALIASGWLKGNCAPMVLEGNDLSWNRWHKEMNDIKNDLLSRSKSHLSNFVHLPNDKPATPIKDNNKEQQMAIDAISDQRIILLSGGPGTGKTSTVIRMIERALSKNPSLLVGLAAPTGKASRRLQESLQLEVRTMQTPSQDRLLNIPCNTLHRWLQANQSRYGRNKNNPLNIDLLVVDEMSMVDLELMRALLDAIPKTSQLVLVGDPNQLPPVGSGAIWHQLQDEKLRHKFNKGAIHLHKLYRNRYELASLSKILCEKGLMSFWEHLNHMPDSANIQKHEYKKYLIPTLLLNRINKHSRKLEELTRHLSEDVSQISDQSQILLDDSEVETNQLFHYLNKLMVLCPRKKGPWGVKEVHKALLGRASEKGLMEWPQGTPIICKENQRELGLANGDIGILIGEKDNRRIIFRTFTEDQKLTTQLIHPSRIKGIEPALAITIHKAQGSEADEVILLWPESAPYQTSSQENQCNPIASYEKRLLYTAITRAKNKVDILVNSQE